MGKIIKSGIEYAGGGGGGGGDVTKQYVDTQDAATLQSAKDYTDTQVESIEVPTVVQTTGSSTTNVMSQKAVTDMVYGVNQRAIYEEPIRSVWIGGLDTSLEAIPDLNANKQYRVNDYVAIAPRQNGLEMAQNSINILGANLESTSGDPDANGHQDSVLVGGGGHGRYSTAVGILSDASSNSVSVGAESGVHSINGKNTHIGCFSGPSAFYPMSYEGNTVIGYESGESNDLLYPNSGKSKGGVSLGAYSLAAGTGTVDVSTRGGRATTSDAERKAYGYNNTMFRKITGVHDGSDDHDAATVGQLNTAIAGVTPPTVVQTRGDSTTDVMSQKAVTDMIFYNWTHPSNDNILIAPANAEVPEGCSNFVTVGGATAQNFSVNIGSVARKPYSVVVGKSAVTNEERGVAIGFNAVANATNSVAIGAGSWAGEQNTVAFGGVGVSRRLTNLADGEALTDAATVAQGNKLMTTAPATNSVGVLGQLWTDTTNMHTYQCTAIDTTDPQHPVYTWTQRW